MIKEKRSLEETPTWAVSAVCFFLVLISLAIDKGASKLTKCFQRRKRKPLNRALAKIKTEMMILGFVSLLLTVSEVPISKICVTEAVASSFLPCRDTSASKESAASSTTEIDHYFADEAYCKQKGMMSIVSRDGIQQLKIFISFLAVFHILYCIIAIFLGSAKIRRWQAWEEETRTHWYQLENDSRRFWLTNQTTFGKRHLKFWSENGVILWLVSFIRQFTGSVSKADYFTLRNSFIKVHMSADNTFNFQKYLARVFDDDFEEVVGMSLWIWIYSIFFIFLSAHVFYSHYWLPSIPLMVVLTIGTKLEVAITKMCLDSSNNNSVTRGAFVVMPNNNLFWFGQPEWLLHLFQFILFQESFQLAFFIWTWYEYGPRSCFNRETEDISLRVIFSVVVQFLCGYVTLPLYALVTQMGAGMKPAVFGERVALGIKRWHKIARQNLQKNRDAAATRDSSEICPTETQNRETQDWETRDCSCAPKNETAAAEIAGQGTTRNPRATERRCRHLEIIEEEPQAGKSNTRGAYDGEISFASAWKDMAGGKGHGIFPGK